jgi:L-malate glycosyltransferase
MVLYFGNILSKHGKSLTIAETLGPRLAEYYPLVMASSKKNKLARLLDMMFTFWKYRSQTQLILIDCYSSTAFWYVVVVSLLATCFKIPYVPILHGGDLPARLQRSKKISRYVFKHAVVNISPSKYLLLVFSNAGYKVEYIPNYIEIENYQFTQRSKIKPKLLWVRSFHKIYNPDLAIEILSSLRQTFQEATLCMVGPDKDGSLKRCQELVRKNNLEDAVVFTGHLTKQKWITLSEHYDVFINTTNFDNMPVSVIEAMALGLPVVSSNAGGLPYLIDTEQTGLLVDKGDRNGFVEAIKRLLHDEKFAEHLAKSARMEVEQFDGHIVEGKWKELIDRVSFHPKRIF